MGIQCEFKRKLLGKTGFPRGARALKSRDRGGLRDNWFGWELGIVARLGWGGGRHTKPDRVGTRGRDTEMIRVEDRSFMTLCRAEIAVETAKRAGLASAVRQLPYGWRNEDRTMTPEAMGRERLSGPASTWLPTRRNKGAEALLAAGWPESHGGEYGQNRGGGHGAGSGARTSLPRSSGCVSCCHVRSPSSER